MRLSFKPRCPYKGRKVPYDNLRHAATVSGMFCLVGTFPRWFGLNAPKPEHLGLVQTLDGIMLTILIVSVLATVWALVHNAGVEIDNQLDKMKELNEYQK